MKLLAVLLAAAMLLCGCEYMDDAYDALDDISSVIDAISDVAGTDQANADDETDVPETATEAPVPTEEAPSEAPEPTDETPPDTPAPTEAAIDIDGEYSTRDEVALYIHTFGRLPKNYITKKEAESRGWDSKKGNLWDVAYGKSIGGDTFGNREGLLPGAKGRKWYECDIGYEGGYRGGERIVFSNDGLIYYSASHYQSFERLY